VSHKGALDAVVKTMITVPEKLQLYFLPLATGISFTVIALLLKCQVREAQQAETRASVYYVKRFSTSFDHPG
jgi:hypothetical protein